MIGRIVEVADDRRHLFVHRGFMVVRDTDGERNELGRVPLDDIAALIANAHGLSYTNNLLVELAERGAPFVLCAANHNPVGMLWSLDGNYQQAKRFDAQIAAKRPTNKRLWADIVKSKIQQQATVLEACGNSPKALLAMVKKVKSGDATNMEAQAARAYWQTLFGSDFRRDNNAGGTNAMLNYGYTILRSATARAVIAAGLHPTIALHHSNAGNPMRLVDDLIEPFRPLVDLKVWQLIQHHKQSITPETKRALVHTLYDDMETKIGATPVMVCMQKLATSLAQLYLGAVEALELPLKGLPLSMATNFQET